MKEITVNDINKAVKGIQDKWYSILPPNEIEFRKPGRIRDPIHGYHKLLEIDFALLDIPPLQRLRYISQLGFVNKIYPGANHTRFEHSIGVAAVAERIMNALREKHQKMEPRIKIKRDDIWTVKIAGYVHDIGHLPFSHGSEKIFEVLGIGKKISKEFNLGDDYKPHELFSYLMTKTEYIKEVLKKVSDKCELNLDAERVAETILGRLKGEKRYLSDIIHSHTDADRIDYLLRDGYYTGVPHGHVDIEHLARSFCVVKQNRSIWLGIEERGLEAVEALYSSRDVMYPTVYFHHTNRIAEAMLTRTLYYAHRDEKMDILELLGLNDAELIARINEIGYEEVVNKLLYRRLHKRIFVIRPRDIEYKGERVDKLLSKNDSEAMDLAGEINDFFSSWDQLMKFEEEIISDSNVNELNEGGLLIDIPSNFITLPKTEADLIPEDYLPVRLRQGGTEYIWKLSPIIVGIETRSKYLRSNVIVATDCSIKGSNLDKIRKAFKEKIESMFQIKLLPSAFFKRNL